MLAVHRALLLAKKLGFQRLIVEGDSKVIINAINGEIMAQSEFGHILQDIKSLISSFCSVSFCHVRRQGNCLDHCLARRAISRSFGFIFCFFGFDGDWVWLLDLDLGFARDWFGYFLDLGRT